ncbi:MAG: hypothetical protein MRZ45_09375 [Blautia sp.]|nr:hypothetical protein [Blautia sp.]
MTEKQERIWRYMLERFEAGSVALMLIGSDRIRVTDGSGVSMTLTLNQYGDIIDADTGQVYAISDLPHDHTSTGKFPTSWKDVDRWADRKKMP